jgi:hypothetical protein
MIMSRSLLLAAALTASTASDAMALYRWQWDGAIKIVNESAACNEQFVSDNNLRAIYQPDLPDNVQDRNSSLTIFRKTGTEMIQNFDPGQFSGTGLYNRFTIADGKAGQSFAQWEGEWTFQSFNFTQTPAVVGPTTNFVTLIGTLRDYGGIETCTVTLRGSFVGVDSEVPPPGYGDD